MTLKTRITELLGIEHPVMLAGLGGVGLSKLAAAVSEAGGLGTIALVGLSPEVIHREIAAARRLTAKPLAVNLLVPFIRPGIIEAVLGEPIDAVSLFWGDSNEHTARIKRAGMKVIWQCGSVGEAVAACRAGADAIVVQGIDAGGHVRGKATSLALIPAVRDALGAEMPILAAGGFADGRGLAAALALGADGVALGTRFVASTEAAAHPLYQQRLLAAQAEDTVLTTLYDVGWPNAGHRVIRTRVVDEWESAGHPEPGKRPGEGEPIGVLRQGGLELALAKYSVVTPSENVAGDIDELPHYAGMSVNLIHEVLPAGEIVRRIIGEAQEVIARRLASVVV